MTGVQTCAFRSVGRALTGPQEPDKPADLEIVHPDVKRMLLQARSFVEGARALPTAAESRDQARDPDPDRDIVAAEATQHKQQRGKAAEGERGAPPCKPDRAPAGH